SYKEKGEPLMRLRRTLAFILFAGCILAAAIKLRASENKSGSWTIHKSDEPGKIDFALMIRQDGHSSNNESAWPASQFSGVDFSKPGRQDVHFTLPRDAGKLDCEGFLDNGEGAGIFHFEPNASYPGQMKSLGFSVDDDQQYQMAVHDVSLDFARQIKSENL